MFRFFDAGSLVDGELALALITTVPGDEAYGRVPAYQFRMLAGPRHHEVGYIELRVGDSENITCYAGHIGYRVFPSYRGHHYAARACRLLIPLAHRHGLDPLWITCDPDNLASRRTCELAGAVLVDIVDVPRDTDMHRRGELEKCRYRLDVNRRARP